MFEVRFVYTYRIEGANLEIRILIGFYKSRSFIYCCHDYSLKIKGSIKLAMITPPSMKQQVAMSDGHCKLERPMMAWPDVQPPAYRVPKPTRKPPTTMSINPFSVSSMEKLKSAAGTSDVISVTP